MTEAKITSISWDWQACPGLEDLQHVLRPFGLFVYNNPQYWGQDKFAFLISDKQLDDYELAEAATDDFALAHPTEILDRDAHRTALLIHMNEEKRRRNGR